MSWRDELTWADSSNKLRKKASFRNAYFFVKDADTSFGRRNIVHQYPKRDVPFVEDLGLDIDEFGIEGYVIQNAENEQNYFEERDALIDALREEGPGQLWHPFLGVLKVSLVGKVRMRESFKQGGIARFSMNFVRAEEKTAPYPEYFSDYVKAVDEAVEKSIDDGVDGMGARYDGEDVPDFSSTAASASIISLNAMLRSVTASIQGAGPAQISKSLTILSEEYSDVNNLITIADACELANGIIGMGNGLLSLIGEYGDIVVSQLLGICSSAVRGIISGPMSGAETSTPKTGGFAGSTMSDPAIVAEDYGQTVTRAALAMNRFGEASRNDNPSQYGGTLDSITINTVSRAQQSANQVAIVNMARLVFITIAARAAIRIQYTSHDAVVEMMDEVVDAIDVQLLNLGNDAGSTEYAAYNITIADPDNYQALKSLRHVFVQSMLGIGASLASIVEFQVPPVIMSSLVLAHDKYEDLGREKEIIARNTSLIKHPGFLPGGQFLEILNE